MKAIREQIFKNHVPTRRLHDALKLLEEMGDVRIEHEQTGGRDRTVVTRVDRTQHSDDAADDEGLGIVGNGRS